MKFAIFFYVVAIASVAQAQLLSLPSYNIKEKIEEAKQKANELTKQASDLLHKTVDEAKEKTQNFTEQLKENEEKVKELATGSVDKIVQGANEEIAEAEKEAKEHGVKNTANCTGIARRIPEAAKRVVDNIANCVNDKVKAGEKLVSEITKKSTTFVTDLSNLKKQIEQCDQSTDVLGKVSALSCLTTNGAKASMMVTTQIPSLTFNLKKLTGMISTLRSSLQKCIEPNINAFKKKVKATVGSVKKCLGQQV